MKISVDFKDNSYKLTISVLPISFEQMCKIIANIDILEIVNIHIYLWDKDDNNQIVNLDNYHQMIKLQGNIDELNSFLRDYSDYSISKLRYSIKNGIIEYDDDSLLSINIELNSYEEIICFSKSFCHKYLDEILNVKNLGLLI